MHHVYSKTGCSFESGAINSCFRAFLSPKVVSTFSGDAIGDHIAWDVAPRQCLREKRLHVYDAPPSACCGQLEDEW